MVGDIDRRRGRRIALPACGPIAFVGTLPVDHAAPSTAICRVDGNSWNHGVKQY
jgi:hypothetical protein